MLIFRSKKLSKKEKFNILRLVSNKFKLFNNMSKNKLKVNCEVHKGANFYFISLYCSQGKNRYYLKANGDKIGILIQKIYHQFNKQFEKNKNRSIYP